MPESINPFISNFLGPIILIGIILIGFGVMTGQDVSKLLGGFTRLIASCLLLIMNVLQHVLSFIGKILVHFLKGIGKQLDHTLKHQSKIQNAASNSQWSKPANSQNASIDPGTSNKPPGPPTSSGDIKIIYDSDPDDD